MHEEHCGCSNRLLAANNAICAAELHPIDGPRPHGRAMQQAWFRECEPASFWIFAVYTVKT